MISISDPNIVYGDRGFYFLPKGRVSFNSYIYALKNPDIIKGFINTAYYVLVGTVMSMFFTILGAYVLSRKGLYWNKWVMKMILFTMYFQGGLIPLYLQVKNMGMLDMRLSVILPILITTWNLIVLRTAFFGVSAHLIEAAKIDSASEWRLVWQIAVPVSKASVAVVAHFYAVRYWNEWFHPSIFLMDREKWPLQLVLRETGTSSAMIIITALPMILLYLLVQKYFTSGMMVGSVKE